jgi:hypothetical protein
MDDTTLATADEQVQALADAAQQSYEDWRAERAARGRDLVRASRRSWAAVKGWDRLESQEDWERLRDQAVEDWESGAALLEMLGGSRYLEPERAALLLTLWQDFLATYQPTGPAEYLVIAMAVLAFDHFLRVNTMVHNLATRLEDDFFGFEPLHTHQDRHRTRSMAGGLVAERFADEFRVSALPLLDRLNRLVLRNLRALRELKGGALSVTLANYGQVNLAQTQTNHATSAEESASGSGRKRRRRRAERGAA